MSGPSCEWLWAPVRARVRQVGDNDTAVRRKVVLVHFLLAFAATNAIGSAVYPVTGLAGAGAVLPFLLWPLWRREAGRLYLGALLMVLCAVIAYWDLLGASTGLRLWPVFVIVVDMMLVVEAPRVYSVAVMVFVAVYLCVVEVEFATRALGLFDLPESPSYAERQAACACERPPCAHGDAAVVPAKLSATYLVFVLDFLLTRGFADAVLRGNRRVSAAVAAAEDVAKALARFDLQSGRACLTRAENDLPADLHASLTRLLDNLESYRPYLPSELFAASMLTDANMDGAPPGTDGDAHAAFVFTDIRSSTALWESSGEAMAAALELHDTLIRTALRAHGGYEIKTIGDAFMIAFRSSADAVRFSAATHTALAGAAWPAGLTRPGMDDGFGVLSVRIGVHCGAAHARRNLLTGRFDYFGPTVNRAARAESLGTPGAVTVTAEVLDDIEGEAGLLQAFVVIPHAQSRVAKGLDAPMQLTSLVPRALAATPEAVRNIEGFAPAAGTSQPRDKTEVDDLECLSDPSGPGSAPSARPAILSPAEHCLNAGCPAVLRAANACVGVVKFHFAASAYSRWDTEVTASQQLQAVHASAFRTAGHVVAVVNSTAVVTWGLHGLCADPVVASARFLAVLADELPRDIAPCGPLFHAGLATGPLATAELVVTGGRRFVTPFGACVDLAMALCHGAAELGTLALAASVGGMAGGYAARLPEAAHPVQDWDIGGGASPVKVCDMRLEAIRCRFGGAPRSPNGGSESHATETRVEEAHAVLGHAFACLRGAASDLTRCLSDTARHRLSDARHSATSDLSQGVYDVSSPTDTLSSVAA